MTTIPHTAPTRPQRRRKPDPQSVYQTYLYEARERGQRNAARATADRYGLSDDTVRRWVAKVEAAERASEELAASDLAYIPPPFADELAAKRTQAPSSLTEATAPPAAEAIQSDRLIMSSTNEDAAVEPQNAEPQRRPAELAETPQPPPPPPQLPELPPDPDWLPDDGTDPTDRTRTFDEPAPLEDPPPAPIPPYPSDPLDPTKPATVDPSEVRTPGRMETPLPVPAPLPEPVPGPLPSPEPLPQPEPFPVPVPVPGPNPVRVVRQVVRVPVERPAGGLVGWLASGPMIGPFPVWALLVVLGAMLAERLISWLG